MCRVLLEEAVVGLTECMQQASAAAKGKRSGAQGTGRLLPPTEVLQRVHDASRVFRAIVTLTKKHESNQVALASALRHGGKFVDNFCKVRWAVLMVVIHTTCSVTCRISLCIGFFLQGSDV